MVQSMSCKKYYWLKLKDDFFSQPKIKKLRKIAGGDTYTIIYLKMQLLSIKTDGIIAFEGIEATFHEEVALTIDEDPENVSIAIGYLMSQGLIMEYENSFGLVETMGNIGSETQGAERVRRFREVKKALHCNADVTNCNADVQLCNTEIREKREEIREKREIESYTGEEIASSPKRARAARFTPPSISDISDYCRERRNAVDPERFFDHYESNGWMVGKTKMKDWKASVRNWERNERGSTNAEAGGNHRESQAGEFDEILKGTGILEI